MVGLFDWDEEGMEFVLCKIIVFVLKLELVLFIKCVFDILLVIVLFKLVCCEIVRFLFVIFCVE